MNRLSTLLVISALTLTGVALLGTKSAQAQTFTIIYAFTGQNDGYRPYAGLTLDRAGNLYGTTTEDSGPGTVFQLKRTGGNWNLTTLGFTDGIPSGRVVFGPNGTLYGTTNEGGSGGCQFGCGTVYSLQQTPACINCPWTMTVLYSFTGGADGSGPYAVDLVFDQAGDLYGTTAGGGSVGHGVVFKLTPSGSGWTESVIHDFSGAEGIFPASGVIFDSAGNLYGTTERGGAFGKGTVYRLARSGSAWVESTLYSFQGGTDQGFPVGGLLFDRSGNLYGTTTGGGGGSGPGGTVFELSPSGENWIFHLLYAWGGIVGGGPQGNLAMDAEGNLYGATSGDGAYGEGSVFKLAPFSGGWSFTDLHDFTGFTGGITHVRGDGAGPTGGVILDANGNVYGTTAYGGIFGESCENGGGGYGCGVVWQITP
jgi:uncharacterized repeat protein (TIGR03803 family)